ncbi:hypothetical protein C0Q70_09492 [Pomacea canaliculata]|uniref:Uncharacterized protein n=1 Tax=Pomacea canaliculata TaxID=400727 RepID=A0A2T7P9Y2_POMCA|nr:hypothetical protein C0Q70_09492 [Pomacea canaliculata]
MIEAGQKTLLDVEPAMRESAVSRFLYVARSRRSLITWREKTCETSNKGRDLVCGQHDCLEIPDRNPPVSSAVGAALTSLLLLLQLLLFHIFVAFASNSPKAILVTKVSI